MDGVTAHLQALDVAAADHLTVPSIHALQQQLAAALSALSASTSALSASTSALSASTSALSAAESRVAVLTSALGENERWAVFLSRCAASFGTENGFSSVGTVFELASHVVAANEHLRIRATSGERSHRESSERPEVGTAPAVSLDEDGGEREDDATTEESENAQMSKFKWSQLAWCPAIKRLHMDPAGAMEYLQQAGVQDLEGLVAELVQMLADLRIIMLAAAQPPPPLPKKHWPENELQSIAHAFLAHVVSRLTGLTVTDARGEPLAVQVHFRSGTNDTNDTKPVTLSGRTDLVVSENGTRAVLVELKRPLSKTLAAQAAAEGHKSQLWAQMQAWHPQGVAAAAPPLRKGVLTDLFSIRLMFVGADDAHPVHVTERVTAVRPFVLALLVGLLCAEGRGREPPLQFMTMAIKDEERPPSDGPARKEGGASADGAFRRSPRIAARNAQKKGGTGAGGGTGGTQGQLRKVCVVADQGDKENRCGNAVAIRSGKPAQPMGISVSKPAAPRRMSDKEREEEEEELAWWDKIRASQNLLPYDEDTENMLDEDDEEETRHFFEYVRQWVQE